MNGAAEVLGRKGAKLHTHGMHLRRTQNGYIARHELRDKNGNPPNDGQSPEAEYNIANPAELAAHVQQHMAPPNDEEEALEGEQ